MICDHFLKDLVGDVRVFSRFGRKRLVTIFNLFYIGEILMIQICFNLRRIVCTTESKYSFFWIEQIFCREPTEYVVK